MKRALKILLFVFVVIVSLGFAARGWLLHTDSGAGWVLNRATNSLAEKLTVGHLSGNFSDGLVLNNVVYKETGLEIEMKRVETTVEVSLLPLQLYIKTLSVLDLSVWKLNVETASSGQAESVQGMTAQDILEGLKLPIEIDLENVEISGFNLRDSGNETLLHFDSVSLSGLWKNEIQLRRFSAVSPSLDVNLRGHISLNTPFEHQWVASVKLSNVDQTAIIAGDIELQGLPDDYRLKAEAVLEPDRLPAIQLALEGRGGLESISLDHLDLDSDFLQAGVTGRVDWSEQPAFDLALDVVRMEPSEWIDEWPRDNFIYGQVSLQAEQAAIRVPQFDLQVAGTDIAMQGDAVLDPLAGVINGKLSWQNLVWPLGQQANIVASDSGQLILSGAPEDWRFDGSMKLEAPQYPGGNFELTGNGDMGSANITIDTGEVLGGTLKGQASIDWSSALRWSAELDVEQLDLAVLLSDWPARLDAKLSLSQDMGKDVFELQLDNLYGELQGEFEGQNVTGQGGLVLDASGTRFKNIQLHSGHSGLSLHGNLEDSAGLEFAVDVHPGDWIAEYTGGQVNGRGRIAPFAPKPVVDVEFEAENLRFRDMVLQSARVVLGGDRERQSLDISLKQADYEFVVEFSGALSDWNALAGSEWQGQLELLSLVSSQQELVTMQDAAPFKVSGKEFSLGETCLNVSDYGGMCVESRWQSDGQLVLAARLADLSLNASKLLFEHDIEFTQRLNGEIRWLYKPGEYPSGRAAINISPGTFGIAQEEVDLVTTAEGFFGFELSNGNLTAGELDIPFPGIGMIDLDYAISGMALDGTGGVDGKVKVEISDISALDELLPALDKVSGQLNMDLQVSGVTIDPVLQGTILLSNAAADIPDVGTQLRNVSLQGIVSSNDNASLQGEFDAGDGHGKIAMTVEYADWLRPAMEMTFSGSSLRMLNTPELRMNADTDITLAWQMGEWSIDGELVVQEARIAPVTFVVAKVTESEDIRIVAGNLPYGEREEPTEPVSLNGQLEVRLGDEVQVDTDLAKLQLSGEVLLTWDGQVIPVADGSIHADGTLSVFGPKLFVKDGQARFPGVPVNNPMLDIRAERDIFGNTQIRTAGVAVSGSANRPVIEAYTNPLTTRDRAWAVLITGNDVDYGQGVGAFEVGAYIAPRLYLSYGISLFDDDNVVSARYDLKRGFGVKISSGQRENGVDLSYTIDR